MEQGKGETTPLLHNTSTTSPKSAPPTTTTSSSSSSSSSSSTLNKPFYALNIDRFSPSPIPSPPDFSTTLLSTLPSQTKPTALSTAADMNNAANAAAAAAADKAASSSSAAPSAAIRVVGYGTTNPALPPPPFEPDSDDDYEEDEGSGESGEEEEDDEDEDEDEGEAEGVEESSESHRDYLDVDQLDVESHSHHAAHSHHRRGHHTGTNGKRSSSLRRARSKSIGGFRITIIGELSSPSKQEQQQQVLSATDSDTSSSTTTPSPPYSDADVNSDSPPVRGSVRILYDVESLLDSPYDSTYSNASQPVWICVEDANELQYEAIGNLFDLHPLTVEDCQSRETREKLEIFHHYLFIVFQSLHPRAEEEEEEDEGDQVTALQRKHDKINGVNFAPHSPSSGSYDPTHLSHLDTMSYHYHSSSTEAIMPTTPIKLIVFPHLVLSFHSSRVNTVASVRHRLSRVYANRVESVSWIIHAMLDCIVDSLLPVVEGTSCEVDALEDLIYVLSGAEHRDLLKRMGVTRRRLHFLRQRLWSKRDILLSLIGKDWQYFLGSIQIPYLRDVYDHVVTMLHKVEASSDLLSTLQNTYLANVSIDVSEASTNANQVMKQLSAVATIILPLSLVAGVMGMNVEVPFQTGLDHEQTAGTLSPFIGICTAMLLSSVAMAYYFRKKQLL